MPPRPLPDKQLARVTRLMGFALVIGVVSGLGAIVFNMACSAGSSFFLEWMAGYRQRGPANEHHYFEPLGGGALAGGNLVLWAIPLVAMLGGLLSGLLVYWTAREASGHGTDAAIDAYHNKGGAIRLRVPLVKIIASALTIGSGGSGGREGPIAQIGAGVGSWLGKALGLSRRERRILLASGIGAGVGSIFHAPLAGALFAAEVFYSESEFEAEALIPAAVSTIISYSVFALHSGDFKPLFEVPDFGLNSLWELLPYTVLAVVVTLAAGVFTWMFYGIHGVFDRMRIPAWAKPMVGAGLTGLVGVGLMLWLRDERCLDVLSFGYGTLQDALQGQGLEGKEGLVLLLALAFGKMLTTSLSIGSGGSGGVFGPSMVVGGCCGGVVGILAQEVMGESMISPGAFVVVGMAGFFTAATKTPISTIVMASEMTGNYFLLLPSLWVAALAFLLSGSFKLYRSQVPTRLQSNAHKDEVFVDVLEGMRVADIMEESSFATVRTTDSLDELVRLFTRTTQHYFPVTDAAGRLVGILSANDVRQVLEERDLGQMVIAMDIANPEVVVLRPQTDLSTALKRFVSLDVDSLPVVDQDDDTRILTMLSRRHLIRTYEARRDEVLASRAAEG